MWYGIRISPRADPEFVATVQDLLRSVSRNLLVVTTVAYALWHLGSTVHEPEELGLRVWLMTPVATIVFALAFYLLPKRLVAAQVAWLIGIVTVIGLALYLFRRVEIVFLFGLLPLLAALTMGWLGGLISEALVVGVVIWLYLDPHWVSLPVSYALAISAVGLLLGAVGWFAIQPLLAMTVWVSGYLDQAQKVVREAREQQLELKQVQEDLIQANRELARLSERLKVAHQAAEEARQAKEQFVANVSHELRTPLNMIIGFTEMIMQTPRIYGEAVPPALLADIAAIRRNSQHLAKLVNDVLDLSQIEAGRMALTKEWTTIPEIVDEAVSAVRALFESKGLTLETELAADLPAVFCDSTRIRQVLLNLLSNAGRFTERGGVRVRAWSTDGEVFVSVSDTGPGIPPEAQAKLFEPFSQLDNPLRRRHGGSGLGLSISRRFVEMHRGRMWVESQVGVGTTITFSLPVDTTSPLRPDAEDARRWFNPYSEYEYRLRTRPSKAPPPTAMPRFVLLEREPAMERLLRRYSEDVEITVVREPSEALEELNRSPAKALIVNGLPSPDLVHTLGGLADLPFGIPTIACWVPGEGEAVRKLGVMRYLVKPVSRETLLEAIEALGKPVHTVLLVDDEPDVLHLFGRMLSSSERRYHVLRARTGRQALNLLRERHPDCMLLDLIMPGMDGTQVLEEKSRDPAIRDIPVIVVTSRDPAGEPIVSNLLAVTRGGGLSARDLLNCIEVLSEALSPSARTDGRGQPGMPPS